MIKFEPVTINIKGCDLSKPVKFIHRDISFWLTQQDGAVRAFYDECAHMGGSLKPSGNGLVCNVHGWSYKSTGENLNALSPGLRSINIQEVNEDNITLILPEVSERPLGDRTIDFDIELSVLSHATIHFRFLETSLLFDPWLIGNAYYGSWQLFPDAKIDPITLNPNAIIITHPHPDHFHLETLGKIRRSIPIFFPRFPSKLIEQGLISLGFTNLYPMLWEEEFYFGDGVALQFLKPRSFWEDSATLLTVLENSKPVFNWLNLVDAGSVIDEFKLPKIDLLSSAYDQGASGYPLTWTHIGPERKLKMMSASKANTRELLVSRSQKLKPKYFLPFAGHWRLAVPEHQTYASMIEHTSFAEIESDFAHKVPQTTVIGVYPGEKINLSTGEITRSDVVNEQIKIGFIPSGSVKSQYERTETVNESSFLETMRKLVSKSEIFGVERVSFKISAIDSAYMATFEFASSRSISDDPISISVKLPSFIINLLAESKANFDHVAIGYWGLWNRKPDVYPSNFMRLLQTGSNSNLGSSSHINDEQLESLLRSSVGELIERNPEEARRILTRIGLPCTSCAKSNSETLGQALNLHQIQPAQVSWLLRELVGTLSSNGD